MFDGSTFERRRVLCLWHGTESKSLLGAKMCDLWKSEILMSKMKMKMRKWVSKVVEMVKIKVELYCYYHHILVFTSFFIYIPKYVYALMCFSCFIPS